MSLAARTLGSEMIGGAKNTSDRLSRRDALVWGAGAAASVLRGGASKEGRLIAQERAVPTKAQAPRGYIDAHVHVWTPDTTRYPLAAGFSKENMRPQSFTPEQLFSHARPCGVTRVVLIQMSFYRYDNSYMLDTIARFPGVFAGVGIVDSERTDAPMVMDTLAAKGVRGFRLAPGDRDAETFFGSEGMAKMWRHGADRDLAMCPLINPAVLPVIDRMCSRFPETKVVIDHFGRVGIDGTIRDEDLNRLCGLARHRLVHVKVSAFYALGKKAPPYEDLAPMIRRLVEAFGPERLMWASDCPFQVEDGHSYRASIDLIEDRLPFLISADREWLLRRTAEKVFFS